MRRIMVSLDGRELSALNTLAERERRDLQAQAAQLIREALIDEGILEDESASSISRLKGRDEEATTRASR